MVPVPTAAIMCEYFSWSGTNCNISLAPFSPIKPKPPSSTQYQFFPLYNCCICSLFLYNSLDIKYKVIPLSCACCKVADNTAGFSPRTIPILCKPYNLQAYAVALIWFDHAPPNVAIVLKPCSNASCI